MLDITAISKTFHPGTPNARQALRQLSLHLEDGEFATIVGSNGAGKSTLFGAIAGSFYTDEGRILLDGTDLTFQPEHRRSRVIGRLFQDPMRGTAPHMTIEENLALAYLRASHGSPFRRITPRDRELFRSQLAQLDMGLEERMHQPVGLLSGGQRQALTLLMATEAAAAGRAHGGTGPRHGGQGAGADPAHRGGAPHHLSDGDPQHGAGPVSGQPHPDDGGGLHCTGCLRSRAGGAHGQRPAGALPQRRRPCAG